MNVDNDRIKTCAVSVILSPDYADERHVRSHLWEQMAQAIIAKLDEFGKLERRETKDGIVYSSHIDVIVPMQVKA